MFNFPETNSPEFYAFMIGFGLPFVSACFGFAIGIVRNILHNISDNA